MAPKSRYTKYRPWNCNACTWHIAADMPYISHLVFSRPGNLPYISRIGGSTEVFIPPAMRELPFPSRILGISKPSFPPPHTKLGLFCLILGMRGVSGGALRDVLPHFRTEFGVFCLILGMGVPFPECVCCPASPFFPSSLPHFRMEFGVFCLILGMGGLILGMAEGTESGGEETLGKETGETVVRSVGASDARRHCRGWTWIRPHPDIRNGRRSR